MRWMTTMVLLLSGAAACTSGAPDREPESHENTAGPGEIAVVHEDEADWSARSGKSGTWEVVDGCVVFYRGRDEETGLDSYFVPVFSSAGEPAVAEDGAFTFHDVTYASPAYFGLNGRNLERGELTDDVTIPEACPDDIGLFYVTAISHPRPGERGDVDADFAVVDAQAPDGGAYLTGHLRIADGCVVLEHTPGEFYLPVFPGGGDPHLYDGAMVFDGVAKALDGYAALQGRDLEADELAGEITVPDACPADLPRWYVGELGP